MKRKDRNTQSPSPAERLPSLDRSSRVLSYNANKEPLFLRVSVSIDPFTDWRQIILSSSHLAAAHPAAAEIRSPSAMRKDGVCERAAEVSVCV